MQLKKILPALSTQPTAPVLWYLRGGIPLANCKAAYAPKGAASYEASLINLANPGTGNATAIGSPQWDATNGWKFPDNAGTGMLTGLNLAGTNKAWSILIRWSNPHVTGTGWLFGAVVDQYNDSIGFYWHTNGVSSLAASSGYKSDLAVAASTIVGIAGNKAYSNGSDIGTISNKNAINAALTDLAIAGRWNGSTFTAIRQMNCQAFVAYDTVLTPAQVSAVTAAMQAL